MTQDKKFNTDIKAILRQTSVFYYKSRGPGGQRRNKKETAVRLYHIPSGVTVIASEHRFQIQNKKLAFGRLQKKLEQLNRVKKPRLPTQMPQAVKERIFEKKKIRSRIKESREKVTPLENFF